MKHPDVPLAELVAQYREHADSSKVISLDRLLIDFRALPEGTGRRLSEQCIRKLLADALPRRAR